MTDKHVSLPRPFSGGDIAEWLQRFDICCDANTWDDEVKQKKLPTLLEGEALAIWLELTDDERNTYAETKKNLTEKMNPETFVALDDFHQRRLRPDESPALFAYNLKKLLERAGTGITGEARDKMILHQFLAGLPPSTSRQLRIAGETKDLQKAIDRARLLIGINQDHAAAVTNSPDDDDRSMAVVMEIKEQVAALTKQVESLSVPGRVGDTRGSRSGRGNFRCYSCGGLGHTRSRCPSRNSDTRSCYRCGQVGHFGRDCWKTYQGNERGAAGRGNSRTGN